MMNAGLICGAGLFLAAFLIHWLLWRVRGVPGAPALSQSIHFSAFLAAYAILRWRSQPRFDLAATLLLYASLACAYIQAFPLALLRSPTLQLLLDIGAAGKLGRSRDELLRGFDAHGLFTQRVEELLRSGMVGRLPDGRLRSSWRGKLAVPVFFVIRRTLGLPMGPG